MKRLEAGALRGCVRVENITQVRLCLQLAAHQTPEVRRRVASVFKRNASVEARDDVLIG